ncbi:hypothetical protein BH780_gp085 [Bacillus phage Eldridge]|uniref:Right handed beta helix domain-containing protein n=1 Tax=Bacillus phage Eldridge TaxID=1776293 RepID=A0A120HUN3_9CAUD|nr:hypothetical protein BH780_gp085 [Bacillus phage Eldridge]AMB18668.1 hypothetical protein Eldridge_088 [Bacillus phage Eldridge]
MGNLFRDNLYSEFPDPNKKIEELGKNQTYTKYFVNAIEAGAKGDGTDETTLLQQALDSVPSGGEFHFPSTYAFNFTSLTLRKSDVKITGKGKLTGTIVVDAPLVVSEMIFDMSGLLFDNVDLTRNAIEVKRARRGSIKGCTFKNCDKTIFANPPSGAADHSIGQVIIDANHFFGVNYAFYVSKGGNTSWMITNDCHFTNNIINVAKKSHVYCESIDGLVVDGNTCFFPNYASQDQVKEFNIYIGGQSDWVIIVNNNLFEAGKDAIKLVNPKRFTIGNNLIAWCGQRDLSDGINISGTSSHKGTIANNTITYPTKHGVTIDQNGEVTFNGNNIEYSATPPSYYGATAMSSITHYALYVTDTNPQSKKVETRGNIYQGLEIYNKGLTPYRFAGIRERKFFKSITAANTPICTLGSDNGDTAQYDGQAIVRASNTDSLTGNTASYILHIGKHIINSHVNKISEGGLTAGSSANHPSFTFSIDTTNNQLLATPVGSTSGTFYFYVTVLHNLTMM